MKGIPIANTNVLSAVQAFSLGPSPADVAPTRAFRRRRAQSQHALISFARFIEALRPTQSIGPHGVIGGNALSKSPSSASISSNAVAAPATSAKATAG